MLISVILGLNKPIWLIFKKQKTKKIVNCSFNIHKYGKNTGIRPILNGIEYSGWCLYDSFNQNMEYLGSVGPTQSEHGVFRFSWPHTIRTWSI